jgi:hypothetical protein
VILIKIVAVLYEIIDYMDKSKSSKDIVLEKEFSGGFYDLSSDIYYSITNVTGSRDLYYYMLGNDIKSIIVVYSGENINVTDVYNLFESEFIFDNLNFNGKLIFDINRFLSIDENDYIRYLIRKFNKKVY